ncbi:MAG: PCRF domain-containing protein, partial [Bdellovibrionales bacterium]|nr:PCRF domain-containing protein [Bdellovibrionales bacterium]
MFGGHFDISGKSERISEIEQLEAEAGFWEDPDRAAKIQQERSILEEIISSFANLTEQLEEFELLEDLAVSEDDTDSAREALAIAEIFLTNFKNTEQKLLLSDEVDP